MMRTTIMADEEIVERLKALARDRGVSFAEIAREALAEKAREYRPKATSLGLGSSRQHDVSGQAGVGRTPPR